MSTDTMHMARALRLAERGRGRTSPNPMVGAVLVDDEGVVIGRGWHEFAGGPHAEVHALSDAGEGARGATLYCTLEPCCHTGRTGPCAPRIVDAGIRRLVVAAQDPNPIVSGRGFAYLRERGIDVTDGVLRAEAERLNRAFMTRMQHNRPFVTLKIALSLDARVAAGAGRPTKLTGAAADRYIHRERAETDAIAVGSGTILTDDPLLTPRGAYRYRPLVRVVFDRRLRIPPNARVLSTSSTGPVIIVSTTAAVRAAPCRANALTEQGVRLASVGDNAASASFLVGGLEHLAAIGVMSMIVEGGPTLHQAFWDARLVDRVQVFVTPRVAGHAGPPWISLPTGTLANLSEGTVAPLGEDVLIEGHVGQCLPV
jgi:diaminohydroxyphosphoribosylaminopyrimidine deaminase/5-amino-6-(5-phosphoribosylamino)uracil reductase